MRSACIDIGSNTTRLLVAELGDGGLREILADRVFTRLRAPEGPVRAEKIDHLCSTVASQVRLAREAGADDVRIVATAAVRAAANREDLCAAVSAAAGVPVSVLSGTEEARLSFLGATRTLDAVPVGTVAVVDVGGGSTEVVCGTLDGGVQWSTSLPIGSGLLTDLHVRSDPPTPSELARIRAHATKAFAGLDAPRPSAAFAVGGSATSLRRLVGIVLDGAALGRAIAAICGEPSEEVACRLDLHPERVRVLPAGMLLLEAACTCLGVPLQIAGGGLREGVVFEALQTTD